MSEPDRWILLSGLMDLSASHTAPTVHPVVRDSTVKAVLSTPEQTKKALKPHFKKP